MKDLKIVVISTCIYPSRITFDVYGSESYRALLADELAKLGNEVYLIATEKSKTKYAKILYVADYKKIGSMYDAEWNAWKNYKDIILSSDFVIDASATCIYSERYFFYHKENFKGFWCYYRDGNEQGFFFPREPVNRNVTSICLSPLVSSRVKKLLFFEPIPIPFSVDEEIFKPMKIEKDIDVLYLHRPHIDKGIITFLRLAKKLKDYKFVLAYDCYSEDHYKWHNFAMKIIKRKGLRNVEYIPLNKSLDKKLELYNRARIFFAGILYKKYVEALGLTSLEALSCGTGVIACKYNFGLYDYAKDCDAIYFTNGSEEEYVKAIKSFDYDSKEARGFVLKNFNKRLMAERFLRLYYEGRD